jgi:hypothetical protein
MGKLAMRLVLPLAGASVLLLTVAILGKQARESLRQEDRYLISFAAIDCVPPPGLERPDFLNEVQYLAGLPERLSLLDDELASRLRAAFARHPWVRNVEDVEIAPPRRVHVRLRYRVPVLAVNWSGRLRAVDAASVLLPATANTQGLPVFRGTPAPPAGPAGTRWGDPAVEAAARSASR